jgi:hypothetical protein
MKPPFAVYAPPTRYRWAQGLDLHAAAAGCRSLRIEPAGAGRATVRYVDDDTIRSLVARLARAHPSGGTVIERAAIVAEGGDAEAVMSWIVAHGGEPEAAVETSSRHGLHGSRLHSSGGSSPRAASRFLLPPGALD